MRTPHLDRMNRIAGQAATRDLAAIVIAPSPDLIYLTGYAPMPLERPTLLILRPDRPPTMLVPALERALAAECPVGTDIELVAWTDAEDPYEAAAALLPDGGRVAVGDRLWASHLLRLQRHLPEVTFGSAAHVIAEQRAVKDAEELATLRRAGRAADETFRQICTMRFLGRREEEIASQLAELLVHNGHARADFTIVASGPNAASPHHEPSGRTMLPRDAVVMDFGGELAGYYSDTTRTVVVGEPSAEFERVYRLVLEAQEAAFRAARPGVAASAVDHAARALITDAGYGEAFFHRTGHGIGLEVHEAPYIVEGNPWELRVGTTFSIEPGVYLDGRFGVRIEDIVAITDDGAERLNRSTRELQVVN